MQIEYALNAVNAGATSLGIKATNGVVLATEKKLPSILVDESTVQKISLVTPNMDVSRALIKSDHRLFDLLLLLINTPTLQITLKHF